MSGAAAFSSSQRLVIEWGRFAPNKYSLILPTGNYWLHNLTGRVDPRPRGRCSYYLTRTVPRRMRIGHERAARFTFHVFREFLQIVPKLNSVTKKICRQIGHATKRSVSAYDRNYLMDVSCWSGRQDSNLRPHGPEPCNLTVRLLRCNPIY